MAAAASVVGAPVAPVGGPARLSFATLPDRLSLEGFGFGRLTQAEIDEAIQNAPRGKPSKDGRQLPRANGPNKLLRKGIIEKDLPELAPEDRAMPHKFEPRLRYDHDYNQSVVRLLLGVLMHSKASHIVEVRTKLRQFFLGRCADMFKETPMPAAGYGTVFMHQLADASCKWIMFLFRSEYVAFP